MKKEQYKDDISNLLEIMARLRDPQSGCAWDRQQTFATIAPYTLEEAYEVADAIVRENLPDLCDELGDLLLQVVYHARMAEEAGAFDFGDVVTAICAKMVRRHPHVFGHERIDTAEAQTEAWEVLKAEERQRASGSVLGGVPVALPALTRGMKLSGRASRVGFDWPDAAGVREKLDEELAELDEAQAAGNPDAVAAEMGDTFFTLINLCRHLGLDPERCVREANGRFETRFRRVENRVQAQRGSWGRYDPAALERLWQEAKQADAQVAVRQEDPS